MAYGIDISAADRRPRGNDRGAETRDQLVNTALRLFAVHGYHGVTTRMVTKEAGANLAAINYHFGSKQGLYRAVVDDIAGSMSQLVGPMGQQLAQAVARAGDDREALAAAAHGFCRGFVTALIGETKRRPMVGLVIREFALPTEVFPVLFGQAIQPMHRVFSILAAAASGRNDPDDEAVVMQGHALLGMCMSFAIARVALCRRLDWDDYTPARVTAIAEAAASVLLSALRLPQQSGAVANG